MLGNILNQLRENSRLRWGVLLILGIIWLYSILLLRENLQVQAQQYQALAQSISRLQIQMAQTEWAERVTPAKVIAVQLEGELWQAPTTGLAQAAFQDWLNAAMVKAHVTRPQISVTVIDDDSALAPDQGQGSGSATPSDLWKIKAKLSFEFNAATLMDFMKLIESHEKKIVTGTLNVRKEPAPYVEMEVYGYFQKQAAPASKPNKETK